MDERTLRVHQIKLMVDAREDLRNCSGVADHAHCPHDLGKVTTRHNGWWLVVDTTLEASRGPVNKLDRSLRLDCCNCGVHVLGDDVPRYIKQQAMYLPWRGSHFA